MTAEWKITAELPIGIEVDGPLSSIDPASADTSLRDLFYEHKLLIFRDQHLTHEQQVAMSKSIGPVPRAVPTSVLATDGQLGDGELVFHSDLAFDPHPHLAASLHALEIEPAGGTSTDFLDCVDAYERLSPDLRARVDGLYALHVFPGSTTQRISTTRPEHYPRAVHPVAWAHHATGKRALYVNTQATASIVGLASDESDALLQELFDVLYNQATRYSHQWRTGDVVLWDNRALQHARNSQMHMRKRVLQRVIIDHLTFNERYDAFIASDAARLREDPALQMYPSLERV
ncbi:MAG: taurine dioxygenase [Acidimicrobiales bacterium]|nr:taurine dioxygenase [Acidimicrobiales bacterium]